MANKKAEELLKKIPFGSPEWYKQRKKVVAESNEKYNDQYVLCVPGKLMKPELPIHEEELRTEKGLDMIITNGAKDFFQEDAKFIRRSRAEFNLEYKQVNVFCLIYDDYNMIVLKKLNGAYSLPGGHVDFTLNAYRLTINEILHEAIEAELVEEITNPPLEWVYKDPFAIVNTNNEWNDLFHLGVMYDCRLPGDSLSTLSIGSNEPDKHTVELLPIQDVIRVDGMHQWTKLMLQYLHPKKVGI